MTKGMIAASLVAVLVTLTAAPAVAADQERKPDKEQTQERIFGSQLMTQQERLEYRAKLRAATGAEERERIRKDHHERMLERAKARGVTLPDEPPAGGGGAGMGRGRSGS